MPQVKLLFIHVTKDGKVRKAFSNKPKADIMFRLQRGDAEDVKVLTPDSPRWGYALTVYDKTCRGRV